MGKLFRNEVDPMQDGCGRARFLSLAMVVLALGLLLADAGFSWGGDASLLAQRNPFPTTGPTTGGSWFTMHSWLTKVALLVVALFAALLFFFLVVFRWLLTKRNRMWPLTAYGVCMALVLTVVFGVGLFLFWDDLVFGSKAPPKPWYEVWGGRAGVGLACLIVDSIVMSVFRSPHARRAAKAVS